MYNDENLELSREEMAALAALPRELEPGNMLEARVLHALRDQGHFGSAPHRAKRAVPLVLKIAAAIALFAGGVATGRYALATNTSASASSTAPVTDTRDAGTSVPRNDIRPVQHNETVVAVREMWL
jgi:hypothetical protein